MKITDLSFLASVFWSSLLMLSMYALRKFYCIKSRFNLWVMLGLYFLCMLRAFFPAELKQAVEINDYYLYAWIYRPLRSFLRFPLIQTTRFQLSVWQGLLLLWGAVSCILLVRHFWHCHRSYAQIRKYAAPCSAQADRVLEVVQSKFAKPQKISLYTMPEIDIPFCVGIFRKAILIPQKDYTTDELYYILLHESTHLRNRDTAIQFIVSIFCCIFWWNPVVYLIKADVEQTLEIRCDTTAVREMQKTEKAAYLRTIVNTMRDAATSSKPLYYTATALVHSEQGKQIKERFGAVLSSSSKPVRKLPQLLVTLSCVVMLGLSYILLPQPAYEAPPSTEPNTVDFDPSNTCVQRKEDGTYWLCNELFQSEQIAEDEALFYQKIGFTIKSKEDE